MMLPRLLRHCYCYADSRFSNPIVPARTRQGKSSRFDVLIRPSDASGNSFPRTLPMHKVELRRQVGALVRGKNGRGFSRHAGVYSSDVGRSVKPTRLSLGDGCIPAVPASVSPGFVVPLTPLADPFFARHRTRVRKRCGRIPVPVPMRLWNVLPGNAHPTIPATHDVPRCGQTRECLADTLVAHADGRAE